MKRNNLHIILISLICLSANCQSTQQERLSYSHPIPFAPEEYVCYTTNEKMLIDGKDDESAWQNAPWTKDFVDIEGSLKPLPFLKTNVKMLWDDEYFYFFAKLYEPHVWAKLKQRDDVIYYDDDFEIFIDPDGDSHNYYELEVNAFNTLWDLILLRPYRVDNNPKVIDQWNISDIKTAVHVEGTLNDPTDIDEFWTVEWAVPWTALEELAPNSSKPKSGDQWRVNFSRVDWTMEENRYDKKINPKTKKPFPENNWVWSPTGRINMHMPEMWGFVQFSDLNGSEKEIFIQNKEEEIKWNLWNMYWQMKSYFKKNGKYTSDLSAFTIPKSNHCKFEPKIYTTPNYFEIQCPSCKGQGNWLIQKNGKVIFKNK